MIEVLGGDRGIYTINATPTPASGKFPPPPDVTA